MVFFYLVTTNRIFDISLIFENSISQSKIVIIVSLQYDGESLPDIKVSESMRLVLHQDYNRL